MKHFLLMATTLVFSGPLHAGWKVDSPKSEVSFLAVGKPGFLKIPGEKALLEGTLDNKDNRLQGQFEVTMDTFVTGMDLRDKHMKENHFETVKYPKAKLVLDPIPMPPVDKEVEFSGQLKLKGTQKPIKGLLTLKKSDATKIQGEANFTIKLTDYPELGVPKYMGITMAEDVRVSVNVVANRVD